MILKKRVSIFFLISLFIHIAILLNFLSTSLSRSDGYIHVTMEPKSTHSTVNKESFQEMGVTGVAVKPIQKQKKSSVNDAIVQESSSIMNRVVYPAAARHMGWQGSVKVEVKVVNFKAEQLIIVKGSGHDVLDQAAITALKEWSFQEELNNRTFELVFQFVLQ